MKIIVTGLPRCRTSLVLNSISDKFSLKKPNNQWGETHKFGENINEWLEESNAIYKFWPIHSDNFIQTLEDFDGMVIVSYTEDFPLFVAKLLRSHVSKEWGINPRVKEKISYRSNISEFYNLEPTIRKFQDNLIYLMGNQRIVLKSAFMNRDKVAVHIQSSFDVEVADHLRTIAKGYSPESLTDYITESPEDFYEFIHTTFGSTF